MLCLLHMGGHFCQRAETLTAPHALEDLTRLLSSFAQPHVLATHQFAWQLHLAARFFHQKVVISRVVVIVVVGTVVIIIVVVVMMRATTAG